MLRNGTWGLSESVAYPDLMWPNFFQEDTGGNLWIATWNQGLMRLSRDGAKKRFFSGSGFPTDSVRCWLEDREGNFWVGGDGGGLMRLTPRRFSAMNSIPGMPPAGPSCVAPEVSGAIWLGFGDGLRRMEDGRVSPIVKLAGQYQYNSVWTALVGSDGREWFGAYGLGLFEVSATGEKFWQVSDGLPSNDQQALCEDRALSPPENLGLFDD